jgi:hypothetical protein
VFVNLNFQRILKNAKLLRYSRCVADHLPYCADFKNTNKVEYFNYEGNSISKLQIQDASYVSELSAGNCHR